MIISVNIMIIKIIINSEIKSPKGAFRSPFLFPIYQSPPVLLA